jgi:hypothetical protein
MGWQIRSMPAPCGGSDSKNDRTGTPASGDHGAGRRIIRAHLLQCIPSASCQNSPARSRYGALAGSAVFTGVEFVTVRCDGRLVWAAIPRVKRSLSNDPLKVDRHPECFLIEVQVATFSHLQASDQSTGHSRSAP